MITTILTIYFGINCFMCRAYYMDNNDKWKYQLAMHSFLLVFGGLFFMIDFMSEAIKGVVRNFHLDSLWDVFVKRAEYIHKADIEHLYTWNKRSRSLVNSNSVSDKIYRWIVNRVNKINKYDFDKPESEDEYKQFMRRK